MFPFFIGWGIIKKENLCTLALVQYPHHPRTAEQRILLQNLGKSDFF